MDSELIPYPIHDLCSLWSLRGRTTNGYCPTFVASFSCWISGVDIETKCLASNFQIYHLGAPIIWSVFVVHWRRCVLRGSACAMPNVHTQVFDRDLGIFTCSKLCKSPLSLLVWASWFSGPSRPFVRSFFDLTRSRGIFRSVPALVVCRVCLSLRCFARRPMIVS
jgi:hypothetical protein